MNASEVVVRQRYSGRTGSVYTLEPTYR